MSYRPTRRQRQVLLTALQREENDRELLRVPGDGTMAKPFESLEQRQLGTIESDGFETVTVFPAHVREKRVFTLTEEGRELARSLRS